MNGSRLAETVSVQVMPSSSMPSSAAMILATSTSKPSGSLVAGLSRPNPGWSNLVPMVISPAAASSAMVEPSGNSEVAAVSSVASGVSVVVSSVSSLAQAARLSVSAAAPANARIR